MQQSPLTAIVLGAGMRGALAYGPYALTQPQKLEIVGVAEPHPERQARFVRQHEMSPDNVFATWEDVFNRPKFADAIINTMQDQMHYEATLAALAAGYDVLLEKPMTNTLAETVALVKAAEKHGRMLQICHVLRYTNFFAQLNEIVRSGRLGDLVTVTHHENVRYTHMAHSFVRGNWAISAESSPMILAKCCHDLDILQWNINEPVTHLQSFGSLRHFRPENAPENATARCTDPCPAAENCAFDARRYYLEPENQTWAVNVISEDQRPAALRHALETGPYGRCVYQCDNDVVDHQTVNMQFASGVTAVLVMHGHSHEEGRTMRYDGTRATLRGKFGHAGGRIEIHDHLTNTVEVIDVAHGESGHGGGDLGLMADFVQAARGEKPPVTAARESLESHLLAHAAEQSRLENSVVDMTAFRNRAMG